ncbi:AAA family ATPase, partial [Alkaliphilus serpentinus]
MNLSKIEIQNFRKFKNVTLSFDSDITLLAGANNSGKTSIIEFLDQVINGRGKTFKSSDLPVKDTKDWIDEVFQELSAIFSENLDEDSTIKKIIDFLFPTLDNPTNHLLLPTTLKLTVDYNPESDDIRLFADYIMDFDPLINSFYFKYSLISKETNLSKVLSANYRKLKMRFEDITIPENEPKKIDYLKDMLISIYIDSLTEHIEFTDSSFSNCSSIDGKEFRSLFNFNNVCASRNLDDQNTDTTRSLSKNLISLSSHDDNWKQLIESLPDKILQRLETESITEHVHRTSMETLSDAITAISEANGGNTGDMILNIYVTEDSIKSLISQVTNAKYQIDDLTLGESSQGLGYSNMIYILVQLEDYKRSINPLLVNMFFIEEPESHMHPQMQNVFGKYLRTYYRQKGIQGLITTHSSEIVRVTDLKKIRISKSENKFKSKMLDLSSFKEEIKDDPVLDNLYDWFFEVGFSEVVFADRVIFYEGDTERLLIRKLATFQEYSKLNELYIAFVQVGGAYAYNYKRLLEFMGIKSLIITDLDYAKAATTISAIESSETSNSTISNFYKENNNGQIPTVKDLYTWKSADGNIILDGKVNLCYQNAVDGYSRTLEEAMLAKLTGKKAYEALKKSEWKTTRSDNKVSVKMPT